MRTSQDLGLSSDRLCKLDLTVTKLDRRKLLRRVSDTYVAIAVALFVFLFSQGEVKAAPGDLDPAFGTNGRVLTSFATASPPFAPRSNANALAIQPDGKIIAAGQAIVGVTNAFALVRYNPDGSLDASFGGGGQVTTRIGSNDTALAVALQSDGKIVAAGFATIGPAGANNLAFALVRYNADGSLDASFDGDGMLVTDLTINLDEVTGVAIQPDGKIVAAGFANAGTGATDFAVARYNSNGGLDTSFGNGGIVLTDFFNGIDGGSELVLLPDGKIVVAGSVYNGAGEGDFALVRYNPDGALDASFGTGGKVTTNFSSNSSDTAADLSLTPDNKLVVAGLTGQPGAFDFAVARYNADGGLDTTFDGDGKFVNDFSGNGQIDAASGVAVQQNGKIVVAGEATPFSGGGAFDFALLRLNPDGTIDSSFGTNGKVFTDFGVLRPTGGFTNDDLSDVIIQPDGKIVVAGDVETEPNRVHDFGLARYLGDAVTPTPSYTLTPSPSMVTAGGSLTVSWTAPSGRPATDWIGLYRVGDPPANYLWWNYTDGAASGSITLSAPSEAGQYEFRYFLENGFTVVAQTTPITVTAGSESYILTASPSTVAAGGELTINWTAPSGRPATDWIGLYRVGDPPENYLWWSYTDGAASGSITLSATSEAGQYEFRYFLENGFVQTARSNIVMVP